MVTKLFTLVANEKLLKLYQNLKMLYKNGITWLGYKSLRCDKKS